jgi:hypothetical protein
VAEIDGTGGLLFLLSAEDGMFNFELRPKQ